MSEHLTSDERQSRIQEWVTKVQQESLPAFSESVQQLSSFTNEDEADLEKLSALIKKDAGLSTKILRASNNVYRTRRGRINTVSRAIVMLGVKEVKKICLTCSLIDGLTDGSPPQELVDEMSLAFHAATQSRLFALLRGDPHSEEVFLSALMLNIGPLAIWKVAAKEMKQVNIIVQTEQCPIEEAEEQIFGFTLAELSRALAQQWNLNQFIPITTNPTPNEKKRFEEITLSTALARSLPYGWESKVVDGVLVAMQQTLSASADAILAVLRDATREMEEMATSFGIQPSLEPLEGVPENLQIAKTQKSLQETEIKEVAADEPPEQEEVYVPVQPNMNFQLETLRNLSALMTAKAKPTMYVLHAIGGIHRGVGIDRVLFAILNDSRTMLSARLVVGPQNKTLKDRFIFDISPETKSLFQYLFESNQPLWAGQSPSNVQSELSVAAVQERLECKDFFLAPVVVNQKWVGVFYADMAPSERKLTADLFDSFHQFTMQTTIAFQHFEFMKHTTGAHK